MFRRLKLKELWPWGVLAASLVFFAWRYVPAQTLNKVNCDVLIPHFLFQDIVQEGHSLTDWQFGGALFFFPDYSVYVLLDWWLGDGIQAQNAWTILFHALLVIFLTWAYVVSGGKRPKPFAVFAVLTTLGLIRANLIPNVHYGTLLLSIAGYALAQKIRLGGDTPAIPVKAGLGLLVFLGALSDSLLIVTFCIPFCLALFLEIAGGRPVCRRNIALILLILAGAVLARLINPFLGIPMMVGAYTALKPEIVQVFLPKVWMIMQTSPLSTRMLFDGDLLLGTGLGFWLGGRFLRSRMETTSAPWFIPLTHSVLVVIIVWSAVVLTGTFVGLEARRYVTIALLLPPMLLCGFLCEKLAWPKWSHSLLALAAAGIATLMALSPPLPNGYWIGVTTLGPALKVLMDQEEIEAGLSDYWNANLLSSFSNPKITLRAVVESGSLHHWFSNLHWYTGFGEKGSPPSFRLILMDRLNPEMIRNRYGLPRRVEKIAPDHEVWIYPHDQAIRYNPIWGDLSNQKNTAEITLPVLNLPSHTGHLENASRVARASRDPAGYLCFGPYLQAIPGRYRLDFYYGWLTPPSDQKPALYDCVIRKEKTRRILDQVPLPSNASVEGLFSRTITVPVDCPKGYLLEARLYYQGSGDLRLDKLRITRLDP